MERKVKARQREVEERQWRDKKKREYGNKGRIGKVCEGREGRKEEGK